MNNIDYISYKYAYYIFNKIKIKNKYNNFIKWKKFLKLLVYISKNNIWKKFFLLNKIKCLKEIYSIISLNLNVNYSMKIFIKNILYENMWIYVNLIYLKFIEIYKNKKNLLYVIIYSSNNINKYNLYKIKKKIKIKFNNKKIYFFLKKNINIIAGFKIYINDFIIDASLINYIKKINFILTSKKE